MLKSLAGVTIMGELDGLGAALGVAAIVLAFAIVAALILVAVAIAHKQFWVVALIVGYVIGRAQGGARS